MVLINHFKGAKPDFFLNFLGCWGKNSFVLQYIAKTDICFPKYLLKILLIDWKAEAS